MPRLPRPFPSVHTPSDAIAFIGVINDIIRGASDKRERTRQNKTRRKRVIRYQSLGSKAVRAYAIYLFIRFPLDDGDDDNDDDDDNGTTYPRVTRLLARV